MKTITRATFQRLLKFDPQCAEGNTYVPQDAIEANRKNRANNLELLKKFPVGILHGFQNPTLLVGAVAIAPIALVEVIKDTIDIQVHRHYAKKSSDGVYEIAEK